MGETVPADAFFFLCWLVLIFPILGCNLFNNDDGKKILSFLFMHSSRLFNHIQFCYNVVSIASPLSCYFKFLYLNKILKRDAFTALGQIPSQTVPQPKGFPLQFSKQSGFRKCTNSTLTRICVRFFTGNTGFSHIDEQGKATMVDVSSKPITSRVAIAVGRVWLNDRSFEAVDANAIKKGDVLTVAKIAGIMGAKRCSDLIPLCHGMTLTNVDVIMTLNRPAKCIDIEALTSTYDRTGVEMEALTAVSVAALTIYDMCKALGKDTVIGDIKLKRKAGGASGEYVKQ